MWTKFNWTKKVVAPRPVRSSIFYSTLRGKGTWMHGQRGENFEHISKGLTDQSFTLFHNSVLNWHRENSPRAEIGDTGIRIRRVFTYLRRSDPQIDLKGVFFCRQHLPEQWQSIYYRVPRLNESGWRWPEVIQHQIQVRGQRWQQLKREEFLIIIERS